LLKGEVEDFVRRFKAGEFAERSDALKALELMIARVGEIFASLNEVIERIRRDFPEAAAANVNFVQTQQNMNEVAACIRQMKERLGCQ
jgi:hypothetical protein